MYQITQPHDLSTLCYTHVQFTWTAEFTVSLCRPVSALQGLKHSWKMFTFSLWPTLLVLVDEWDLSTSCHFDLFLASSAFTASCTSCSRRSCVWALLWLCPKKQLPWWPQEQVLSLTRDTAWSERKINSCLPFRACVKFWIHLRKKMFVRCTMSLKKPSSVSLSS